MERTSIIVAFLLATSSCRTGAGEAENAGAEEKQPATSTAGEEQLHADSEPPDSTEPDGERVQEDETSESVDAATEAAGDGSLAEQESGEDTSTTGEMSEKKKSQEQLSEKKREKLDIAVKDESILNGLGDIDFGDDENSELIEDPGSEDIDAVLAK